MSLQNEPETVAQHTDHRVALQSLPHNRTVSDDGRMLDNCDSDNVKQSECFQNTAVPKFPSIDSCDCRDMDINLSGDIMNSIVSLHPCDEKPKNVFPNLHLSPLKLGNLLGGVDGGDSDAYGVNSTNSNGMTKVSKRKETSKAHVYDSSYEESLNSSCQGTSEGITYPSSTYVTSDSQAFKMPNNEKVANNKMCLLSSQSSTDFRGNCNLLKTRGKATERTHNNINPIKNSLSERTLNLATVQNNFSEGSAATSTTYRSIQLCKTVREMKNASSEQRSGRKHIHLDETDNHSILNHIPVHNEGRESSSHHAAGVIELDMSRRKLLGSALRYLLLGFFGSERCHDNGCICHRMSSKSVTPRNNIHNTSFDYEDNASERGGRNVCHRGTHVNLTSALSNTDCAEKRTAATDGIVNGVMEAADGEGSDSIRYM
jgi:hypothetical protein